MEEYITACPRNCYSTCTFRVQVENNKIIRILPYSGNLATPQGPCIKGLSYIERVNSPERITYPLLQASKGKFQRISINEAFDIIAGRLGLLHKEGGQHSVLWYRGSGMSGLTNEIGSEFWKGFGGATTTYGNLCWPSGLEAVRLTLGTVKHNVPWDLVNARTIIIWGKNPAETNIQEISFIAGAREKGSKIVVIDPVRTPTSDKADIFFSPRPGTDAALALAVAWVLIKNELIDRDFIRDYVKGFEEFSHALTITPDVAEHITGIPAENINELANIIGKEGPVTILPGYGLQRYINGGQTIRSILALTLLTGNIGKPGSGFNYANLQSYIFDHTKEPLSYYPDDQNDRPFRRSISMAKLGIDMLNEKDPVLKAAWIERANPLLQSPDTNRVREAFSKLDFIVVVDQFMTDTAELADIILPAKEMFEQSDIIGSYWSPYVQFKPKVIQPQDEILPESEIYYYLAKKLNLNIDCKLIPEPGNNNIEEWLDNRIKGYSSLCLDDLKKGPVLAPGLQQIAYEDHKFDTASGKIELWSDESASRWGISQLPEYFPIITAGDDSRFPLSFITPNAANRIHSQFGNLKIIKETTAEPAATISVSDAEIRSISTGNKIRIFNNTGEIVTRALISNRIPAGTIVLPNGIWLKDGGGGNYLIAGRETDMGYGAAFHGNRVEVERVF
jgi:anaerobic selenocysteine-containing dehydrogenase